MHKHAVENVFDIHRLANLHINMNNKAHTSTHKTYTNIYMTNAHCGHESQAKTHYSHTQNTCSCTQQRITDKAHIPTARYTMFLMKLYNLTLYAYKHKHTHNKYTNASNSCTVHVSLRTAFDHRGSGFIFAMPFLTMALNGYASFWSSPYPDIGLYTDTCQERIQKGEKLNVSSEWRSHKRTSKIIEKDGRFLFFKYTHEEKRFKHR